MRSLVVAKGFAGATLLLGASIFMNWTFWAGQGTDLYLGRVLGSASVGADLLKATLPVVIAWAWSESRPVAAFLATLFFVAFFAFSLFSALGFANATRGAADATREGASLSLIGAKSELKELEERRAAAPLTRPRSVIEEAIARSKQDRRWASSNGCQDATVESSWAFCRSIGDLRLELASSAEVDQRQEKMRALSLKIAQLVSAGAGLEPDPQAGMLAKLTPFSIETSKTVLITLFAVVVEIGASFGFFFALLPLGGGSPLTRPLASHAPNPIQALPPPTRFARSNGNLVIE